MVFAEAVLGMPNAQRDADEMQARFAAMDRRGSYVYRREQAAFVLYLRHDPAGALALAQQNWTVQRAPKDVRIYLEAALAAGKPEAAMPALVLIEQSHLQDPPVNRLAEKIHAALGKQRDIALRGSTP